VNGLDGITFDELGLIKVFLLFISDSGQLCSKLDSISIVSLVSIVSLISIACFWTTFNLLIGTFLVLKIYLSLSAYKLL
jgi:hypothetical protein